MATLSVKAPDELSKRIELIATETGLTKSAVILKMLVEGTNTDIINSDNQNTDVKDKNNETEDHKLLISIKGDLEELSNFVETKLKEPFEFSPNSIEELRKITQVIQQAGSEVTKRRTLREEREDEKKEKENKKEEKVLDPENVLTGVLAELLKLHDVLDQHKVAVITINKIIESLVTLSKKEKELVLIYIIIEVLALQAQKKPVTEAGLIKFLTERGVIK
jgi:hypothetical protein